MKSSAAITDTAKATPGKVTKSKTDSKPKSIPRSKTLTYLARKTGLTVATAKGILIEQGILKADGTPTDKALKDGLVQVYKGHDKFPRPGKDASRIITYNAFDSSRVLKLFPEPDPVVLLGRPRSFRDADNRFRAIILYGLQAISSAHEEEELMDWVENCTGEIFSSEVKGQIEQVYFHDMHFHGGPFAFECARSIEDIESIYRKSQTLITAIARSLQQKGNTEKLEIFNRAMEICFKWLRDRVK